MSGKTYKVIFSGAIAPGAEPEKVKRNVAALFKVPPERIVPLFSGKPVVLKKNLDKATALKYIVALKRAGALARVVDGAAATSPSAGAASSKGMTLAEPGVTLVAPKPVSEPNIDVSALSLAETGTTLMEPRPVAPLKVDLEALSLAEPGVTLIEPEAVAPLDVNVAALSMAEPGATLVEPEQVEPLEVDIRSLSMT